MELKAKLTAAIAINAVGWGIWGCMYLMDLLHGLLFK